MYIKIISFLLTSICLHVSIAKAQVADSIKNYIDSAIYILQQHSLYADTVNWAAVQKQVYAKAIGVHTKAQAFEALSIAFNATGDKHAAYYLYDDAYRIPDKALENRYDDSIKAAWKKGPSLKDTLLGNIAYINVPFMNANTQKNIDWYANWLYDAVAALAVQNLKGWIIDLRLNAGGNIRPMMQGLAMFFDDGIISYYIGRNGIASDEAAILEGDFLMDGAIQASIKNKIASLAHTKVAVLIGPGTASSGEGLAANFKQRKNTQLFGEETSGRANSTLGFTFNNGQCYFLISTAFIGNKNKQPLPEFVTPHQLVKANNAFSNPGADNVVAAAINWLKQ